MLVFDLRLVKSSDAKPPASCYAYKKQETIDAKVKEWEENAGWASDPNTCVITHIMVPNPEDPIKDIELPLSDNSIVELVQDITNSGKVVVCDEFTFKSCLLATWLIGRISELKAAKQTDEQKHVVKELSNMLKRLYEFKLKYIAANFVYGNNHNLLKTLKWDTLDSRVMQQRLGLAENATRLTALATLAELCGGDALPGV